MTAADTTAFEAHRDVLGAAARCTETADYILNAGTEFGLSANQKDAVALTGELSDIVHTAAASLLTDPTLATEPWQTGRFRIVDLFCELVRQVCLRLRHTARHGQVTPNHWEETLDLHSRVMLLGARIPTTVPRADTDTPGVVQRISEERMATMYTDLTDAAGLIRAAAARGQFGLSHPSPRAQALTDLARAIEDHAQDLALVHDRTAEDAAASLRIEREPDGPEQGGTP